MGNIVSIDPCPVCGPNTFDCRVQARDEHEAFLAGGRDTHAATSCPDCKADKAAAVGEAYVAQAPDPDDPGGAAEER